MSVLLFFIDGFGMGQKSKTNPIYKERLWQHLIPKNGLMQANKISSGKNYCLIPTDAILETPGVPQSATGQTALFTGVNAPKIIGGHITAFPGEELAALIKEFSLLKQLKDLNYQVTSANAYSTQYFDLVKKTDRRVSASTHTILAANIPFKMLEDLSKEKAVFMDITHTLLKKRYPEHPLISAKQAARSMGNLLCEYDFVLYEFFWTDFLGHKGSRKEKKFYLGTLNAFLKILLKILDMKKHTIIISSDHGNIEDSSQKGHTLNPVPTIVFSKKRSILNFFKKNIHDLTSVPQTILRGFKENLFP